ncbi:sensor histidine kinase [Actinomadura sp. DC4]|uniref:sensor histidine kinase n=1 Tax=Actinomadura sp. DC4 TaxID=3055069 RepID=UPI0025B148C2|nr:sensor histidine kinase [Actinomadura sp. DC4]MDN3353900.1 sensor histidine kinase [Actinomadura sp. DC4]
MRISRQRIIDAYLPDAVVALLVLAVLYAPLVIPRASQPGPFSPWAWVLMATSALPLVWRRRAPMLCIAVIFVSLVAYNVVHHVPNQPIAWGLLVAAYSIAWGGRRSQQVIVLVIMGCTALVMSKSLTTSMIGLLTTTCAYILGIMARRREIRLQALARRAGEMERERELDLARAATGERARIARDMHDILAHAVSLMVVQAEAGPVVVRTDPERAERAFDAIAGAGRDAMVQLRRMLGVLKDEGEEKPRAPQPTVAGVPDLVAQVGGTPGLNVELRTSGDPHPLTADAEVAAYRIVQEALTNTVKHAAATRATVRLDWTDAELRITVTDDGCGESGPPGYGLVGIRERAAACGGTAEAGPIEGGGHRVTAALRVGA